MIGSLGAPGVEAFEAGLSRLGKWTPLARMLLVALAWGEGPGLPWDDIWVPVARALAADGEPGKRWITGRGVRWLLGAAGACLTVDTGPGGRRAYRLSDPAVAAHLRFAPPVAAPSAGVAAASGSAALSAGVAAASARVAAPSAGLGSPAVRAAWRQHRAWCQRRITGALLATVPAGEQGRDWTAAHPYVRAYLARHAAAAGPAAFAELVTDAGFLAAADPRTLTPLMSVAFPALRDTVRAYRRARPMLGDDPRANAAHLQEAARSLASAGAGADADAAGPIHPRYRTRMAAVRRDDSLLTLTGHTAMVYSVAFGTAPDGRLLLASGSDDGTVRLWDPFTGTPTCEPITGHGDVPSALGVAPWGQTMKPSETYWTTGKEVEGVVFGTAADGRLLLATAGCDRTVRVWDPLTGLPIGEPLTGHTGRIWHVAAGRAPDGRLLLATGSDDLTVRVWDPRRLAPVGSPLTGHTDQVVMVALGSTVDGRCVLASGSSDCTVRLWDPLTGEPGGEPLTGHTAPVFSVAFGLAPDGRLLLASAGEDTTIRLWDALTGEPVGAPLAGHTDRVDGLAFTTTSGGRWLLATSSRDQTIRLWDPLTGAPVGEPLTGHASWVFSVAFGKSAAGLLLASGSADTTVRIWDALATASHRPPASGHARWVTSAAFGPAKDGRLLLAAGSGDGTVRVWDSRTGTPADPSPADPLPNGSVPGGMREVWSVAYGTGQEGRPLLAAGSGDGSIWIWDGGTGTPVAGPVEGHRGVVRAVTFGAAPDGRPLLASGGTDHAARLWDPLTGDALGAPLTGHEGWVDALAFCATPAGALLLVTGGDDHAIRLWHPLTGQPAGEPLASQGGGGVRALAVAPGRRGRPLLATGHDDGSIRLRDLLTGQQAGRPLAGHTGWISSLAFTATTTTATATATGRLLLVSGSGDHTVRLWDPVSGACLARLPRGSAVRCVAASGLTLAVGDDNGITLIELDEDQLRRGPRTPGSHRGHGPRWPARTRHR